jgi:hypothetical protein
MFTRKKAVLPALVLVACLLSLPVLPAAAQDLTLNMSNNTYAAYVNEDGTVTIVQDLTFVVPSYSVALDYVDVGLPNDTYNLSQAIATLDGAPLTDVSRSSNIPHGLKVVLDPMIQPGQTGTLHVEATVSKVLFPDTSDTSYTSINLSPTYFDGQYMTGTGRLEVQLHFPRGMTSQEPRWHDQEPTETYTDDQNRQVYAWIIEGDDGATKHIFGASFPKSYVPAAAVQSGSSFNIDLGSICKSPVWVCGLILLGWVGLTILGKRAQNKRKLAYLPPTVAVEGTGIKRGLTAVEAAVLLEAPLNKVLVMILFGLVKKGILTVEEAKPLKVKLVDPQPADAKLWDYEQAFVAAVKPDGLLDETKLHDMVITLIGDVNKKLSGFSRKESKAYYQDIAARAWKQVEAAETPEVLGKAWGEGLEWTMLDEDWADHTQRTFQDRPVIMPIWSWGYRPWFTGAGAPSSVSTPSAGGGASIPVTLPTLPGASFANTVVQGVQNAANSVVSSVERFTGGVSSKTNPPPKVSSSSTRSSGGGHSCVCACACACAGCACACAGGGR